MVNLMGHGLIERLKALGRKQSWLAEQIGVSNQAVTKWIQTGQISRANAMRAAEILEVSLDELLGRDTPPGAGSDTAPVLSRRPPQVPVVGTVQAGDDGYWEELQYPPGYGDGFVRYPSNDRNAYALRVKGDSMRPRIKPGEFILVEPHTQVTAGDEVLVTTTDGRSMVKLLGYRRDGMVELQSINEDHRPITLDESEIRSIHCVAAIIKATRYYREA